MGKCEEADVCVGISTTIKHLYEILGDEKATKYLLENTEDINISDNNGFYNSCLNSILYDEYKEETKVENIKKLLQTRGDIYKSWNESVDQIYEPNSDENLYNTELIVNPVSIFGTERWGYNREGSNMDTLDLDHSLEQIDNEKKKLINTAEELCLTKYSIVMVVRQHSG